MTTRIGTPDWRAVIAAEPSFAGIRSVTSANRFGVLDRDGSFVTPTQFIGLFFDYLVESRKWTGGAARSVATSHLVDRAAEAHDSPVYETPAGFKYIGELINEDKIVIGGEEPARLSIKGHYPEKDGILTSLPAAEAVASRGATLVERTNRIDGVASYSRTGS